MRPAKTILLAGEDEDRLSMLKFTLWTHGYAVTSAADIGEAIKRLRRQPFELLFCLLPLAGVEQLLGTARAMEHAMPTIVYAPALKESPLGLFTDMLLIGNRPHAELLDRVKVLSARKRGPRPLKKPVAGVPSSAEPQIARCAS